MMSAQARADRRGGMTMRDFLNEMARMGFYTVAPDAGEAHAFQHPETGDCRYAMWLSPGDSYSRALTRLTIQRFTAMAGDDL